MARPRPGSLERVAHRIETECLVERLERILDEAHETAWALAMHEPSALSPDALAGLETAVVEVNALIHQGIEHTYQAEGE